MNRLARGAAALLLVLVHAGTARAKGGDPDPGAPPPIPAVQSGDPVNPSTGIPWIIQPGVPLVDWGPDEKWRTNDDVINPAIIGDVDLVVRTGGTYNPASGVFPVPAQGVAAAPQIVAGGLHLAPTGDQAAYQIILSDGAASPAAGHPLAATDLDLRGTLVVAYPDLDGDGVIGPTSADGNADNAIEKQETVQIVGRRLSQLHGGLASGALAVSLGAPASAGGLGLLVAAGAMTGSDPDLYDDAGWISTRFPLMWPMDPGRILGGGARKPDPEALVDLEVEAERTFLPRPGHPVLGTPYAIPLDGSSVTNDLLRAVSGPAEAAAFARPVDPATFVADALRVLRPLIAPGSGARVVVEAADTLELRDDGPGRGRTVLLYPADRLGNAADPPPGGLTVLLEAGPGVRIAAPDRDGTPDQETIRFGNAAYAAIVLDDDGDTSDDGAPSELVAVTEGAASAAVRIGFAPPGAGAPQQLSSGSATLRRSGEPRKDRLSLTAKFLVVAGTDVAGQDLTIALRTPSGSAYQRTIPAGALKPKASGVRFSYRDPASVTGGRILTLVVRRDAINANLYQVRMRVRGLDFAAAPVGTSTVDGIVVSGNARFRSALACSVGGSATASSCVR